MDSKQLDVRSQRPRACCSPSERGRTISALWQCTTYMAAIKGINPPVAELANLVIKTCQHNEGLGCFQETRLTHHNTELGIYGVTIPKTWKQPTDTDMISFSTQHAGERGRGWSCHLFLYTRNCQHKTSLAAHTHQIRVDWVLWAKYILSNLSWISNHVIAKKLFWMINAFLKP